MLAATTRRLRLTGAAVAIAATLAAPAAAQACDNENANPHDVSVAASKRATICLLNDIRRDNGLRAFKVNRRLSLASQRHTNSMTARNFFEHGDFVGRIRSARYLRGARGWTVGENIAWGSWDYATPKSIVRGWMNSSGHRANILSSRYDEIGVGYSKGSITNKGANAAVITTDFGWKVG